MGASTGAMAETGWPARDLTAPSRGSAEGYGSFDEFGNFTPAGATWAMIRKAWRVPRMGFG